MTEQLNKTDKIILSHLQVDAALSVGDLAEKVGISKSACWRRVQKLQQASIIRSRVTLLNPKAIDLALTVFISVRTNQHTEKWATQVADVVQNIPGILEVYRMGGELDYLLKAVVKDMADYDRLYQQLIQANLSDVTSNFVMEEIKFTTALPL